MTVRQPLVWALLTLTLAGTTGCGAAARRPSFASSFDDAMITVGVKTALLNDPGIGTLKIDVHTTQGVVTLSGTVNSREEEAAAIELARKVQGVREVKSELRIEGPAKLEIGNCKLQIPFTILPFGSFDRRARLPSAAA